MNDELKTKPPHVIDDPWVNLGDSIWMLKRQHVESHFMVYDPGYYFVDETDDFNGPFTTKEQAETALKRYVESM